MHLFNKRVCSWLCESMGIQDQTLDIKELKGGISSSVFLIQSFKTPSHKYVLRIIDKPKWLAEEPDLAAHEAAALYEAQKAGLQAPKLIAYSPSGSGLGAPLVLMSYLEGSIQLSPAPDQPWLEGLACQLALIHQHLADSFPWRFQSWVNKPSLSLPAWTHQPKFWGKAMDIILGGEPDSPKVFIHRDYHPMNLLWRHGAVNGVVDWVNACQGPAGVDVAHCRTNLVLMYGLEAAEQFLKSYLKAAPNFIYEPYWDLDSILDMCFPQPQFYQPWQEFGLDRIPATVLNQRVDLYLQEVMQHF